MDRFQSVAHVGKRPGHDNAHRIRQIRSAHLVLYAYRAFSRGRFFGVSCYHQLMLLKSPILGIKRLYLHDSNDSWVF